VLTAACQASQKATLKSAMSLLTFICSFELRKLFPFFRALLEQFEPSQQETLSNV
jgi:hypothetical protein